MGPSPTNGSARHPGGERCHQKLHSDLATSHNPPLPQRKECDSPPGRFPPSLRREEYLFPHLLLSGPPQRAHTGHPRPGRTDRTFTYPNPSIFHRTRKCLAAGNENPSPPVHGTGSPIKGSGGRAAGPEGPCPHVNTRSASFDAKLCKSSGGLPGR